MQKLYLDQARPDFPEVIDSSIREAFFTCPHKAYRSYFEHWKSTRESIHLIAGAAFAKGLEVARKSFFERKVSSEDSVALGVQALLEHFRQITETTGRDFDSEDKNPDRIAGALEFYFQNYPLGNDGLVPATLPDGSIGIECSFVEELPILHPQTDKPILFSGRADMLAEYAGGLYLIDEKTTKSLGATWIHKWDMRGQFSGYAWACRKKGINIDGVIVRGVSILKTKYDHLPAITLRSDYEIDKWFFQFCQDIKRMIQMWEEGYFDYALGEACDSYGGCMFKDVCRSNDPDSILEGSFVKRIWNPITRNETPIDYTGVTYRSENDLNVNAEEFLGIKLL